jgi:hypothetical protein
VTSFNLSSAKITGNPGSSGWAQVHEFLPEEEEKLAARGHIFAVVATSRQEQGVDSVATGRELLARLHEEYYGKEEGTAFNILKSALEKVINEFRESWGDVQVAATVSIGDVVYSAAGGGAQISIFRNGMLASILESTKEEVVAASGYPKDGDMLVLGTKMFFDAFPPGVIKGALESREPGLATESLAPSVHSREDSGSLGLVIIKFEKSDGLFIREESKTATPLVSGGQKIKSFVSGLGVKATGLISKNLPERKIYIKGLPEDQTLARSRKTTFLVGVILLVLLIVSIGFGIRQKKIKEERGRYATRLIQATHEVDEAIGLISLDADRARELFANSRVVADELKNEGVKDTELDSLIEKLDQNQGNILGEYKDEPQLFLDLSILSDGFSGNELSGSSDKFYVFDKEGKKIVGISTGTKKTAVVAGPDQVGSALGLGSYEDRAFILADDGIYEVGKTRSKVLDKDWEGEALFSLYAANIYLVDKGANMIWRSVGSGTSFSEKKEWLAPGITVDFSKASGLAIDGSIWTITTSGKIVRFSLGSPQNIIPTGIFPTVASIDAIYTNETLTGVYLLDKGGKRIVVLTKEGKYKAQYLNDKIGEAMDLVVSEEDKKIILLTGQKLLYLDIKHL